MGQPFKVGVIGAGVMGEALIAALISYGVKPALITISEKRIERGNELVKQYGINIAGIDENVSTAEVLLLVVKPQDMGGVLEEIKLSIKPETVVITFAAGKKISFISTGLGTSNPIVRVMPNTATIVGAGMSAVSLGIGVSSEQSKFVLGFLSATGRVVEVPEDLQDAVTATSGSGPAYFFSFVEAMILGAQNLGLSYEMATQLTVQTIIGAARLLEVSGNSATTLRENVTSPNGTTAAALASFDANELKQVVSIAMEAARNRSQELA